MPLDILAEDPFRRRLFHDAGDFGPEMAGIVLAAPGARIAEGLAWITGSDEMNAATPCAAVEGSEIVPDRRLTQGLVRHPRHERGRCVTFPLNESHSPVSGFGDVQAEIEAAIAGAEGDAPEVVGFGFEVGM